MKPGQDQGKAEKSPPTIEKSWEEVMKRVDEAEKDMAEGWKDDIDTILVFAGLFSAVVTAFTIESLKKLSEDTGDSTVALLKQVTLQLGSETRIAATTLPEFSAPHSYIRINTLWILSLILALVDALFCLVCKQWLREHQRSTKTTTPEELLALRRLRAESFEAWHIPKFLAALPIMLEIALFLFFAGLMELLWNQHPIPFSFAIIAVGGASLFYIGTSVLPTVDLLRQIFSIHPEVLRDHWSTFYSRDDHVFMIPSMEYVCAYKSPQALVILRAVSAFFRISFLQRTLVQSLQKRFPAKRILLPVDYMDSLTQNLYALDTWSALDLNLVQRFSRIPGFPDVYVLKAFRWLVEEFQDTPAMIPHLRNVLRKQDPLAVMAIVFEKGMFKIEDDWDRPDVDFAVEVEGSRGGKTIPFKFSIAEIQLLYYHSIWTNWGFIEGNPPFTWKEEHPHFNMDLPTRQLHAPVTRIAGLLEGGWVDTGIKFLLYNINPPSVQWFTPRGLKAWVRCMDCLGSRGAISGTDETKFLQLVSNIHRCIRAALLTRIERYTWLDALDRLRDYQGLERNYFPRIDNFFPISLNRLNQRLLSNLLENWFEEFERECSGSANGWLDDLCHFIFTNLSPIALSDGSPELEEVDWLSVPDSLDWTPTQNLFLPSFPLLTSDVGVEFLCFVNNELGTREHYGNQIFVFAWNHALDCVCVLNNKPLDYFPRIPAPPPIVLRSGKLDPDAWVYFGGSFKHLPPADEEHSPTGGIPPPASAALPSSAIAAAENSRFSTVTSSPSDRVPSSLSTRPAHLEEEGGVTVVLDNPHPLENDPPQIVVNISSPAILPSPPSGDNSDEKAREDPEEIQPVKDTLQASFVLDTASVLREPSSNRGVAHDSSAGSQIIPIEQLEISVVRGETEEEHLGSEDKGAYNRTADTV